MMKDPNTDSSLSREKQHSWNLKHYLQYLTYSLPSLLYIISYRIILPSSIYLLALK